MSASRPEVTIFQRRKRSLTGAQQDGAYVEQTPIPGLPRPEKPSLIDMFHSTIQFLSGTEAAVSEEAPSGDTETESEPCPGPLKVCFRARHAVTSRVPPECVLLTYSLILSVAVQRRSSLPAAAITTIFPTHSDGASLSPVPPTLPRPSAPPYQQTFSIQTRVSCEAAVGPFRAHSPSSLSPASTALRRSSCTSSHTPCIDDQPCCAKSLSMACSVDGHAPSPASAVFGRRRSQPAFPSAKLLFQQGGAIFALK